MQKSYDKLISKLIEALPFINAVVIIEGLEKNVYYSENWNKAIDLNSIIRCWESKNAQRFEILGEKYILRLYTDDRLIATSTLQKGHIIGIKEGERKIIANIEFDGVIPYAFMEMLRILASLSPRKPYMLEEAKLGLRAHLMGETSFKEEYLSKGKLTEDSNTQNFDIMFTARLMAYYRAQESKKDNPLIKDRYAELLAGDINIFLKDHIRYTEMDYPIVRSYYVEQHLLKPWCNTHTISQIVLLGAGLDTRAYCFEPLKHNSHTIFEVDLPELINYKDAILKGKQPYCKVKRFSIDLNSSDLEYGLINNGFSRDIPTFWILEGLVYYLERDIVERLLTKLGEISTQDSQIFVDIMHSSRWFPSNKIQTEHMKDPISKILKWGLNERVIPSFFELSRWNVTYSFADDYDQGRNVGQRGMVFVHGNRI